MSFSDETIDNGKRTLRLGRVTATNPAKYGERDWKVTFWPTRQEEPMEPTAAEMTFAIGMIAKAQYDVFKEPTRSELWIGGYVQEAVQCATFREILLLSEKCHLNWMLHRAARTR